MGRKRDTGGAAPGSPATVLAANLPLQLAGANPILDSIADGVFTVDRDWCITSFNRAAEQITGCRRERAIGRRCSEVFRARICARSCALARSMSTGVNLVNVPVDIVHQDGRTIPISISTAILHDDGGHAIGGVETFRDLTAINELRRRVNDCESLDAVVGRHPRMRELLDILPDISASDATVLIRGPSGSGKGLLASTIHHLSDRRLKSFVKVNCAALPETLLESELFGYRRGAFTDARQDKAGRIQLAEGGTLFLDEIGDITPAVQVKLLRVVQDRQYEALGSNTTMTANVRIIAATNRDLETAMKSGAFREDLFYRLNIVGMQLPSLAERVEDLPLLIERIMGQLRAKTNRNIEMVSEEAMQHLLHHSYPGNVRELENALEHAFVLCRGSVIESRHLPATVCETRGADPRSSHPLRSAEAETLRTTLAQYNGNRNLAAEALGLHRTTLWRKMKLHGLL